MDTGRWTTEIDRITEAFTREFAGLSVDALNFKPDRSTWSIAQNIDHLIVINRTYYPVLNEVRTRTYKLPWIGRFDFLVKFFGKTILESVSPDRRKKMKTFPLWRPSERDIAADILARFEREQEYLKNMINDSSALLGRQTIISSPANRNIVYYLETAFDIIVTHEKRHLEQAKEVSKRKVVD